ncbi:hypothetical protein Tco_1115734 [Tanacetum coccineum]
MRQLQEQRQRRMEYTGMGRFHRGFRCGRIKELGSLFLFKGNVPKWWDVKVCSFDDAIYQTYVNLKADVNDRLLGVVLLARLLERLRVKEQRRLEEMAKATEAS